MKKHIILIIINILFYSCKTVKINEENYAWKSFDNSELDQSIDLSEYASPNEREGQDPNKLIVVCASGGGSRAAAFNIGIMLELEKILYTDPYKSNLLGIRSTSNVLNEIDYFSTVSGGGWGISSFIAYQYQREKYSDPLFQQAILNYNNDLTPNKVRYNRIEDFPTFNSYEKYLANRADFRYYKWQIGYILNFWNGAKKSDQTMTNRLNAGYLGWSYRANVESRTWRYLHPTTEKFNTNKVDEIVLGDVFKGVGQKAYLPMLITNTTNIDNYKLIPFTPDRLRYWGLTGFTHYLGNKISISNSAGLNDIPLASGTKASSGIPFLISAASFPAIKMQNSSPRTETKYWLHLQDGGIIDQQAMHTAKSILNYHKNIKEKENRIVFIIDASSTGVQNQKQFKKENASRFYNLGRVVAPFSTPNSQYALTRERVKLFENEYNCTVVYLGTEVLLDESLNFKAHNPSIRLPKTKKAVENYFYGLYPAVRSDTNAFLKLDIEQRKLLFSYISKYVKTWFASKGSKDKGRFIEDDPKSTAKIMFLAGRGVVQLKRKEIVNKIKN